MVLAAVVLGAAGLYVLASRVGGETVPVGRPGGGAAETTGAVEDAVGTLLQRDEDPTSWRISGVVTFSEGDDSPAAQACVRGPSQWIECVAAHEQQGFDLEVSGPGRYRVWASADGFLASEKTVWLSPRGPAVSVELALFPGASRIKGTVVDVAGGPVSGALVAGKIGGLAVSKDDGRFDLSVPPGFQALVVTHPDYASLDVPVSAPKEDVVLALSQSSSVSGFVVDQNEQRVAGAKVYSSGDSQTSVVSGPDGSFRLTGLSAGDRQLEAVTRDLWGVSSPFRLRLPDNLDGLEIRLAPTPSCSLRILRREEPLQGASVKLTGPLGDRIRGVSDENGLVLLGPLSEGDYEIAAECETCIRLVTTRRLTCDTSAQLELEAGRTISGRVEDPDANALVGATIILSDPSGDHEPVAGTSRGGGQFSIGSVWPGEFAVKAIHPAHWESEKLTTSADEIVVRMSQGGTIRGRVVASGNPTGAVVRISALANFAAKKVPVGADGTFSMDGLPLDDYELTASFPGNSPASESVQVSLSEDRIEADVELELEAPERTLAGRVLADGAPASNAVIRVRQGVYETVVSTDQDGEFAVDGLRAERVKVFATSSTGQSKFFGTIDVEGEVILELDAETMVCGLVGGADPRGGPVEISGPSARRRLHPKDSRWCLTVPAGRSGELVSARQGWRYGEATLEEGVEIQLEKADAIVEGVLEAEEPGGIRVWFSSSSGLVYGSARTTDNGTFRADGLPYATVVVSAKVPGCSLKDCPSASVVTGPDPVDVRIITDQ